MDYGTWVIKIGILATGVFYLVRGARDWLPELLAPHPSTRMSRGLTFLLACALGAALGAIGFAPAVVDSPYPFLSSAVSGLIVGAMVFGGAKIPGTQRMRLEDKGRLGKKRKAQELASMSTGEFRAARAAEQTNP